MKKLLIAPLALAMTLGLAACVTPPTTPTETVTLQPEQPEQPQEPTNEVVPAPDEPEEPLQPQTPADPTPGEMHDAFRNVMADRFGTDPGVLDATVELAITFCDQLDTYTYESLFVDYVTQADRKPEPPTGEDVGYVLGAAVPAFCPEHQAEADEFLSQY